MEGNASKCLKMPQNHMKIAGPLSSSLNCWALMAWRIKGWAARLRLPRLDGGSVEVVTLRLQPQAGSVKAPVPEELTYRYLDVEIESKGDRMNIDTYRE